MTDAADRSQQLEVRLLSAQAHAQAVLDTAVDAIITIDAKGMMQSFNRAAELMFGYSAEEAIGQNVKQLMPEPYHSEHDGYLRHYLGTGEKKIIGLGREVSARRKDGTIFPMELSVSEVRLAGEHHFTGIIRDISERKQAEARLRQQQEEARQQRERLVHVGRLSTMGEMAAGIAHEINQPLTAIATYASACHRMLSAGQGESEDMLATLDKISAQAQRAGEVIQRLRRLVSNKVSQRELTDLNHLIRDTLVLAETDARLHNIDIAIKLAAVQLPVAVDPIQIQQVLLNLIRNGLDAMAEAEVAGGTITVSSECKDDNVIVKVSDQGVGLAADGHDNLFNPFYTTKEAGIGLGLSISRSIITSHGGRLHYTPNRDRGLTLYFSLPLTLGDDDDRI